jgi:hypothetical protein
VALASCLWLGRPALELDVVSAWRNEVRGLSCDRGQLSAVDREAPLFKQQSVSSELVVVSAWPTWQMRSGGFLVAVVSSLWI